MAQAIGILGDRWSLILIREALDGATRYDDFKTRLGLSDNTLTRKLGELVESELLLLFEPIPHTGLGEQVAGMRRIIFKLAP